MTCDPSICTFNHTDFIVCSCMENPIGLKRGKHIVDEEIFIGKKNTKWRFYCSTALMFVFSLPERETHHVSFTCSVVCTLSRPGFLHAFISYYLHYSQHRIYQQNVHNAKVKIMVHCLINLFYIDGIVRYRMDCPLHISKGP